MPGYFPQGPAIPTGFNSSALSRLPAATAQHFYQQLQQMLSAAKLPGDVYSGQQSIYASDPSTGQVGTDPMLLDRAQTLASFPQSGGLLGAEVGGGLLGAGPVRRIPGQKNVVDFNATKAAREAPLAESQKYQRATLQQKEGDVLNPQESYPETLNTKTAEQVRAETEALLERGRISAPFSSEKDLKAGPGAFKFKPTENGQFSEWSQKVNQQLQEFEDAPSLMSYWKAPWAKWHKAGMSAEDAFKALEHHITQMDDKGLEPMTKIGKAKFDENPPWSAPPLEEQIAANEARHENYLKNGPTPEQVKDAVPWAMNIILPSIAENLGGGSFLVKDAAGFDKMHNWKNGIDVLLRSGALKKTALSDGTFILSWHGNLQKSGNSWTWSKE